MLRSAIAAAVLSIAAALPAYAATDCVSKYEDFWAKFSGDAKAVPGETVAAINRKALRAFDACQSGDEANFSGFWEQMQLYGEAKDSKTFWEELSVFEGIRRN